MYLSSQMANLPSRRGRKIQIVEAQMGQWRDSITRLEQDNQRLIASNDDLKIKNAELSRENHELKKRLNDRDAQVPDDESKTNTRPPPPLVQPSPPPPGLAFLDEEEEDGVDTDTIVGQVVENIKYTILQNVFSKLLYKQIMSV